MSKKKKQIREAFRNSVFTRDSHTCVFCSSQDNLDAHHITDRSLMPNGGYVMENGITLCEAHHLQVELFHISGHTKWIDGMHPDDLYQIIRSSHLSAVAASERLSNGY